MKKSFLPIWCCAILLFLTPPVLADGGLSQLYPAAPVVQDGAEEVGKYSLSLTQAAVSTPLLFLSATKQPLPLWLLNDSELLFSFAGAASGQAGRAFEPVAPWGEAKTLPPLVMDNITGRSLMAPFGVQLQGREEGVALSWQYKGRGEDEDYVLFHVYRGDSPETLTYYGATPGKDYLDKGVRHGVTYHYGVSAVVRRMESGLTTAQAIVYGGPPAAPSSLQVSRQDGRVTVTWSPPVQDGGAEITGYTVYRTTGGQEVRFSAAHPPYIDTTVVPGTHYSYYVAAVNGFGESLFSDPVMVHVSSAAQKAPASAPDLTVPDHETSQHLLVRWGSVIVLLLCVLAAAGWYLRWRRRHGTGRASAEEQKRLLEKQLAAGTISYEKYKELVG